LKEKEEEEEEEEKGQGTNHACTGSYWLTIPTRTRSHSL